MRHPPLPSSGHPPDGSDLAAIGRLIAGRSRKLVVLDDDPTGTQTVHGLDVLTEWSVPSLEEALNDPRPGFFVLTNSRALAEPDAVALNTGIASHLVQAGANTGIEFSIISRSDSTLRGHFAAELRALATGLPDPVDGIVVIPAFFEGGRYTIDNVHFVAQGNVLVPAAETEFARDATFGFRESDLTRWIEEKTRGAIRADQVVSISLRDLREFGAERVRSVLREVRDGRAVIVNAERYHDLEVFVHGLLLAELDGKRFLFRTAASFVRVRAGLREQPFLAHSEIRSTGRSGGLVVVGSYVRKTSEQLQCAMPLPGVRPIELEVDRLVDREKARREIRRVASEADEAIGDGHVALVFTSRSEVNALGRAGELDVGQIVSNALVEVVQSISQRPSFVIAKGGITSSEIAVKALGIRRARVLGQAAAGIPVWRAGEESLYPGLKYVIFPGNVGPVDALRDLLKELTS